MEREAPLFLEICCCWFFGEENVEFNCAWRSKNDQKSTPKSTQNRAKIDQKSIKNLGPEGVWTGSASKLVFLMFFDPSWTRLGSQNGAKLGAKIDQKSIKKRC